MCLVLSLSPFRRHRILLATNKAIHSLSVPSRNMVTADSLPLCWSSRRMRHGHLVPAPSKHTRGCSHVVFRCRLLSPTSWDTAPRWACGSLNTKTNNGWLCTGCPQVCWALVLHTVRDELEMAACTGAGEKVWEEVNISVYPDRSQC